MADESGGSIAPHLPVDVWQMLYQMMSGQRLPLHVERQAIQAFEAAMHAAQRPPPSAVANDEAID